MLTILSLYYTVALDSPDIPAYSQVLLRQQTPTCRRMKFLYLRTIIVIAGVRQGLGCSVAQTPLTF